VAPDPPPAQTADLEMVAWQHEGYGDTMLPMEMYAGSGDIGRASYQEPPSQL